IFVLYGAFGFFGVPPILRHVMATQGAAALNRPIGAGRIAFNPYRLKLEIDKLHIGDRGGGTQFVDIGHIRIQASWTSLFRLAPIVKDAEIDSPSIHIVRTGPAAFNFSDLIAPTARKSETQKPAASGGPMRFAVSNVVLRDGTIAVDDKFLGEHHSIDHIQVGVPFIADLPADTDIYVQPLLKMVVDGSPLSVTGKAKPFASPPESVLDLNLHRLSIPRYLAYVPSKLPVRVPDGTLSCALQIHFVNGDPHPTVNIGGLLAVDNLDVRDGADSPLLKLAHLAIAITQLEPFESVVHLSRIFIGGLHVHLARDRGGALNVSQLGGPAPAASPQSIPPTPPPAPVAKTPPALPNISLDSFAMTDSAMDFSDNSGPQPAMTALNGIKIGLKNLSTSAGGSPASYEIAGTVSGGGALSIKGTIDPPKFAATANFALDQLDLPALQKFADPYLAAEIAGGKLSAGAAVQTVFAPGRFNVMAGPAQIAIANMDLREERRRESVVGWKSVSVTLASMDLATRNADVKEVRTDGVHLFVQRGSHGEINLASLVRAENAPATDNSKHDSKPRSPRREHRKRVAETHVAQSPAVGPPSWRFLIESIAIEKTRARVRDESGGRPVEMTAAPVNLNIKGVSSDLRKPFTISLDGTLNNKGTFKVAGTVAAEPLKADLRFATKRLDLTPASPYLSGHLNASISSATLTTDVAVRVERERGGIRAGIRGDVTVGSVRMLDKLTGGTFARWNSFSIKQIDASYGEGKPKVHLGKIALRDFYARIILNRDGKLNVSDLVASPKSAPVSLTRPHASAEPAAAPSTAPQPQGPPKPIDADIAIGGIELENGRVNYTDNFIKPNYSANLTDIDGKTGPFGTESSPPAEVKLTGKVNTSAPIEISGTVNPLVPLASLDIGAKADAVDLTGLSPYTVKYTGYPIVKGTLTVNVHYRLKDGHLTAENHILIDQFTFGDHVESPDATNLPVRLAVVLLKNSAGQIDLNVPVSGSLNDPHFSIGSVIFGVFENLIVKAATSPFTLIASTFGSISGGGSQDLSYIEFAPGYDTLSAESRSRLDTIIKAMKARPGLKLDISGRVDPKLDTEGYRDAVVANQVRYQKMLSQGSDTKGYKSIPLTPADYDRFLKPAYKAAKFDKPKNFLGLDKSLPPPEMKKLMLSNVTVNEDVLRKLADARANAVRGYLAKEIAPSRLFVIAPKLDASGVKNGEKTTRVDLSLE
ncbi:MAG TPA: DUF748 domain-containing protein, partial [Candidatus Binataceae bacterium]|nr:DUF748 domain-containing protein [Candidatus Binataceae bacterium]